MGKSMEKQLGFAYSKNQFSVNRSAADTTRVCFRFQQRFPDYIWNDSVAEGKPYTYPQVKTILEGVTHGGSKQSEASDILNQKESLELLIRLVKADDFGLDHSTFCALHNVAAKEEALSWGAFRTGNVSIAGSHHTPPPPEKLAPIFKEGIDYLQDIDNVVERALVFFLFGAHQQFFYDANKRTSRLMMNGLLLAGGYDALVIDAKQRYEYNRVMLELYNKKQGDSAIQFLLKSYATQDARKPG